MGPNRNKNNSQGNKEDRASKQRKRKKSQNSLVGVSTTQAEKRPAMQNESPTPLPSQAPTQHVQMYPRMNDNMFLNMSGYYPPQSHQGNTQAFSPQSIQGSQAQPQHPPEAFMQAIMSKLESIDSRLKSLDNIEAQVDSINKKFEHMDKRVMSVESKVNSMEKTVQELETSRAFDAETIEEIKQKQTEINRDFCETSKQEMESLKRANTQLKEEVIDLQSRSMRDNLLFFNIPEMKPPANKDEKQEPEDCDNVILEFCENNLKIVNAKANIKTDRAHRIVKYSAAKTRPIVAKFNYFKDKEFVRTQARANLKDTPFGVSDQYPREIQERRRNLVPIMRQAKNEGKTAVLSYDKLYIDNKLYRPVTETHA